MLEVVYVGVKEKFDNRFKYEDFLLLSFLKEEELLWGTNTRMKSWVCSILAGNWIWTAMNLRIFPFCIRIRASLPMQQ